MALMTQNRVSRVRQHLPFFSSSSESTSPIKGMVAGMVGGLVASWVMNAFHATWNRVTRELTPPPEPAAPAPRLAEVQHAGIAQGGRTGRSVRMSKFEEMGDPDYPFQPSLEYGEETESPTVKVAETVVGMVSGHPLSAESKQLAGPLVHYAYGTALGGVYGLACEIAPAANAGFGSAFGASAWLVGDELALPALGLTKPPTRYPFSVHANAFLAHCLYGVTVEAIRRGLLRFM